MKLNSKKITIFITVVFCAAITLALQVSSFAQLNQNNRRNQTQRADLDLKVTYIGLDRKNNVTFTLFNASGKELPYTFWANQNSQSPRVQIRVDGKQVYNVPIWRFDSKRLLQKVNGKMAFSTTINLKKVAQVEVKVDATNVVREINEKNNLISKTLRPQNLDSGTKTTPKRNNSSNNSSKTSKNRRSRTGRITLENIYIKNPEEVRDEPYLVTYTIRAKIGPGNPTVFFNPKSGPGTIMKGDNWGRKGATQSIPIKVGQMSFDKLQDYEIYGIYTLVIEEDATSPQVRGRFVRAVEAKLKDIFTKEFKRPATLKGTHQQKLDATLRALDKASNQLGNLDSRQGLRTLFNQYTKAAANDDDFIGDSGIFSISVSPDARMPKSIQGYYQKKRRSQWCCSPLVVRNESGDFESFYKTMRDKYQGRAARQLAALTLQFGKTKYNISFRHEEFVQ